MLRNLPHLLDGFGMWLHPEDRARIEAAELLVGIGIGMETARGRQVPTMSAPSTHTASVSC